MYNYGSYQTKLNSLVLLENNSDKDIQMYFALHLYFIWFTMYRTLKDLTLIYISIYFSSTEGGSTHSTPGQEDSFNRSIQNALLYFGKTGQEDCRRALGTGASFVSPPRTFYDVNKRYIYFLSILDWLVMIYYSISETKHLN